MDSPTKKQKQNGKITSQQLRTMHKIILKTIPLQATQTQRGVHIMCTDYRQLNTREEG